MARTPELLTGKRAAEMLGVDRTTLIRWRKVKDGPPRKRIGKRYYYVRETLKEWLATRDRQQNAPQTYAAPQRQTPIAVRAALGSGTLHR